MNPNAAENAGLKEGELETYISRSRSQLTENWLNNTLFKKFL